MYIKDKMVIDSVAKAVMSVMDEENKKLLLEPEKGEKHEDEAEDKKLIKKMVKKSCHAESKGNQPQETFTDNNMGEDDHKGNKINPKEFEDKLDKKYGKPSPCVGDVKEEFGLEEGSGPKEKQKTPYRNINSPEYRAAAEKQKDKMDKDEAATPGKKLLSRLKGGQYKLDKNQNGKLDAHDFKILRGGKNESVEGLDEKLNPKKRTTDALTGRVKGGDDNEHSSYKVALEDENIEAPKSRARSLAIEAFRKIKKKSMLGQVGTSEEKKK